MENRILSYQINSSIPILLLKLDYKNKEIGVFYEFYPTGDFNKDMKFIESQFKDSVVKYRKIIIPKSSK